MILDVGCGLKPQGTVNVDRYIRATTHRGEGFLGQGHLPHETPNLVCADMNALPFKDEVFEKVFSDNAIEHTATPYKALKEMVRCSKDIIEIKCPHRFSRAIFPPWHWERTHHVSHFNRKWFQDASRKLNLRVVINACPLYHGFPHTCVPILNLPFQIHFRAHKHG